MSQEDIKETKISTEIESIRSLRTNPGGCSSFTAFFNVVCVVAGTGALGLPYALKQGGWIDSGVILIKCLYHNGRTRLTSYQEVAEDAFGAIGGWISFFFTAVTLIGVPVLYLLLSGQNLHAVCKGTSAELSFPIWTIISAAVAAVPFIGLKHLKDVGVLSAFGMMATVVTVFIVLVVALIDKPNYPDVIHDSVIWDQFPIALSSIAFSFGGNPVYAHVEAGMRHPKNWNKVIIAGLTTCVALYFLTAIPGYYVYGRLSESPIYNNIPEGASKIAATVIITIHVILAAPILLTAFSMDLEKLFRISGANHSVYLEAGLRILLRSILIVLVTVIAIYVPYFGDFMALLGAFSNCALIFIFPVFFYLKLTGWRKPWYELILCFLVVLLGVVGLIFGSKSAIESLMSRFE
ncbi:transmembrane amino acid transporter protein-domain-containing protein [Pilobolus umbonatus]|nr:transmembrane amino acid transporter protein-domain-containing protein [Pilobolus umbonatus]